MRLCNQPQALSFLAAMIVCLMVVGAVVCEFHPTSSEHENEMPIGHHHDGHSNGVSCLIAELPEKLVLIELTFVSWVAMPIPLHTASVVSPLFIPPRYTA